MLTGHHVFEFRVPILVDDDTVLELREALNMKQSLSY
jgi:hypothetical protein